MRYNHHLNNILFVMFRDSKKKVGRTIDKDDYGAMKLKFCDNTIFYIFIIFIVDASLYKNFTQSSSLWSSQPVSQIMKKLIRCNI
ncbi:hypothetical protein DERF_002194 [Dermatophagoides farinae]|uniref:Uncharacterized protein n=1 Tax=Dermatophagoides farinae TaxID=6954 RepID=A0A922LA85_DERFA|nr:hypothetical protein DERF_002194 [Dermatophagoides farinae]